MIIYINLLPHSEIVFGVNCSGCVWVKGVSAHRLRF